MCRGQRDWRSDIGKRALQVVTDHLNTLPDIAARRKWVADMSHNVAFIYRDPKTQTGSYRSDIFLRTFAAHLRLVLKSDVSYGHPIGAASLVAAAVERALTLCRDGAPSAEALPRRGKKSAHGFVPVPWADRAANYLKPIKSLSLQKWREIFELSGQFVNSRRNTIDLFEASTDACESSDGYVDPRSVVVISDDEPEDDIAGPSGAGH
ncbi:hypothetical protein MVEN_00114200 [Mycena venus]|uniref:Uncharacterized protein n=1 Tax=Mycena venus TaxID=2733690 RepID=A0A8H7DHL2_9AGAR|nr:hypothetical protein MVEN_00114200 [Mycena venus]